MITFALKVLLLKQEPVIPGAHIFAALTAAKILWAANTPNSRDPEGAFSLGVYQSLVA